MCEMSQTGDLQKYQIFRKKIILFSSLVQELEAFKVSRSSVFDNYASAKMRRNNFAKYERDLAKISF